MSSFFWPCSIVSLTSQFDIEPSLNTQPISYYERYTRRIRRVTPLNSSSSWSCSSFRHDELWRRRGIILDWCGPSCVAVVFDTGVCCFLLNAARDFSLSLDGDMNHLNEIWDDDDDDFFSPVDSRDDGAARLLRGCCRSGLVLMILLSTRSKKYPVWSLDPASGLVGIESDVKLLFLGKTIGSEIHKKIE